MERPLRYDYLIIGGGIAGVTAAEAIRSRDPHGTICLVGMEEEALYSRVLLPSYMRGKIAREKVFLRTYEDYAKKRIDFFNNERVISIRAELREATTDKDKKISYGKLLVAGGGTPLPWRIKGADDPRVLRLQTIAHADAAHSLLPKAAGRALVVGGGFIGLEFIESAVAYGYETHVLIREKKMFGELIDDEGWAMLLARFARHHVTIHAETEIQMLEEREGELLAHTNTRETFSGAWVGLGIGIGRNIEVFEGIGLELARGIKTNEYLETSVAGIWAAGDVAEFYDEIFGGHRIEGNWTNAFLQGKAAGENMAGAHRPFHALSTYSITNLGSHITAIGKVENAAQQQSVVRIWPETYSYERLFFEEGTLVGAVLINRFVSKNIVSRLIESRAHAEEVEEAFADNSFNVAALLAQQ